MNNYHTNIGTEPVRRPVGASTTRPATDHVSQENGCTCPSCGAVAERVYAGTGRGGGIWCTACGWDD